MHISQLRLLSIILLEGFVVLAAEVLAIRQPAYAGSGIEVYPLLLQRSYCQWRMAMQ